MAKGRVDVRTSEKTGLCRFRFFDGNPEQKAVILEALANARTECETGHDTVALEAICLGYLNTPSPKAAP